MFCDMVGSSALSTRLDPEEQGEVIAAFQACCASEIKALGGMVAQYLGDGVLAYFGYPTAHENDAERAILAGLAILKAVGTLTTAADVPVQIRVGIGSGVVVVGDLMRGSVTQENAAIGETTNLVARLKAIAEPNSLVIGPVTHRLVGALFDYRDLGRHTLKGFSEPVRVRQVLGPSKVESRFDAQHQAGVSPLLGRGEELELLLRRWDEAKRGEGRVVLVTGEAGIGKSRIARALRNRIRFQPHTPLSYFCSPHHQSSALYPHSMQLTRAAGIERDDSADERLDKLYALLTQSSSNLDQNMPLFAALLSIPAGKRYPLPEMPPQRRKERTLAALLDQLKYLATYQPVLVVYEDLHWIDPTSLEFLSLAIEQMRDWRVLVLATARPEFTPPWSGDRHVSTLSLNRFGPLECEALIADVTKGKPMPPEVMYQIIERTDGVPLFIEELTKTVLESGLLRDVGDHYELAGPLPPLAIPSTLHASLLARLDHLAAVKDVAQIAAVIGREFSYPLIAAATVLPERDLNAALAQLMAAELIYQRGVPPDATYQFKHALVRDAAYNTILKSRRQQLHYGIANSIVKRFADFAEVEPEVVAHHYQLGGDARSALTYWSDAADMADRRSASREAASHYRIALLLISQVDDAHELRELEIDLNIRLGNALIASEGYTSEDARECYLRARTLSSQTGLVDKYVGASIALAMPLYAAGRFNDVVAMMSHFAEYELSTLGAQIRVQHHIVLMMSFYNLGRYVEGRNCLEEAKHMDDAGPDASALAGGDSSALLRIFGQAICAIGGYLSRAEELEAEAVIIAERTDHMPARAMAMLPPLRGLILRGEYGAARQGALEALALSERYLKWLPQNHRFTWPGRLASASKSPLRERWWPFDIKPRIANFVHTLGRAQVMLGETEEGLKNLRKGCDMWRSVSGLFSLSAYAAEAATHLLEADRIDAAREFVALGEGIQAETEERHFTAELQRLRGRIAAVDRDAAAAETHYREALRTANHQGAKLFSLRAATDLARLLQQTGRPSEAIVVLEPLYNWFAGGWDYPDLQRAALILNNLRS